MQATYQGEKAANPRLFGASQPHFPRDSVRIPPARAGKISPERRGRKMTALIEAKLRNLTLSTKIAHRPWRPSVGGDCGVVG
jgi:hypothetical protein